MMATLLQQQFASRELLTLGGAITIRDELAS
jgi:hypothetical protein